MPTTPGLFVVLEGISGSGKSSLGERLAGQAGWTRVVTITPDLEATLDAVDRHTSARSHMEFWLALQYALRERIEPMIEAGTNVVLESYLYRTLASHAVLISEPPPPIDWTLALKPDIAIWLDVEEMERSRRLSGRDGGRHKSPWHRTVNVRQAEVRRNYASMFPDLVRLDTTEQSIETVYAKARELISSVHLAKEANALLLKDETAVKPWLVRGDARPIVVSFSGIDGSGKSTTARRVAKTLRRLGSPAEYAVPTYRNLQTIREHCVRCFGSKYAYATRLTGDFYLAALTLDWMQWLEREVPRFDPGTILCTDRYLPDVLAQAVRHGASTGWVRELLTRLPPADACYLLNVGPVEAASRLDSRSSDPRNPLEDDGALRLLYAGLLEARQSFAMIELDGSLDKNAVVEVVVADLRRQGLICSRMGQDGGGSHRGDVREAAATRPPT